MCGTNTAQKKSHQTNIQVSFCDARNKLNYKKAYYLQKKNQFIYGFAMFSKAIFRSFNNILNNGKKE